jgi:hypothetical protein
LDPGPHVIHATSPELSDFNETVDIAERRTKTLSIEMTAKETPVPELPPTIPPPMKKDRTLAYIVGGAGAGLLVTGGVFYILQHGKDSDLQSLCGTDHKCTNDDPRPLSQAEQAKASEMNDSLKLYRTLSQVTAIGGILGLGVGVVLYVTAPQVPDPSAAASQPANEGDGSLDSSGTDSAPTAQEPGISFSIVPSAPMAELGGLSVIGRF